jgi:hypothetical protein
MSKSVPNECSGFGSPPMSQPRSASSLVPKRANDARVSESACRQDSSHLYRRASSVRSAFRRKLSCPKRSTSSWRHNARLCSQRDFGMLQFGQARTGSIKSFLILGRLHHHYARVQVFATHMSHHSLSPRTRALTPTSQLDEFQIPMLS